MISLTDLFTSLLLLLSCVSAFDLTNADFLILKLFLQSLASTLLLL